MQIGNTTFDKIIIERLKNGKLDITYVEKFHEYSKLEYKGETRRQMDCLENWIEILIDALTEI